MLGVLPPKAEILPPEPPPAVVENPPAPPVKIVVVEPDPPQNLNPNYDWKDFEAVYGKMRRWIDDAAKGSGSRGSLEHRGVERSCEALYAAITGWKKSVRDNGANR